MSTVSALIRLTYVGADTSSTFNIYTDADGYCTPLAINVSKDDLSSGYTLSGIPSYTNALKVTSNGPTCKNSVLVYLIQLSPTPTPTISVTKTPTISITPSRTATISVTPTISITPTRTATISVTATPTISITPTVSTSPTATISVTPTISRTPTITITPTISITPTKTPTITVTPTISVTKTPTATISKTPTVTPSPTKDPTITAETEALYFQSNIQYRTTWNNGGANLTQNLGPSSTCVAPGCSTSSTYKYSYSTMTTTVQRIAPDATCDDGTVVNAYIDATQVDSWNFSTGDTINFTIDWTTYSPTWSENSTLRVYIGEG